MTQFQVFLLLECYKPIVHRFDSLVAKTKVSKTKDIFTKVKILPPPLKRLIQTHPHMSTSQFGNICIMQLKCSRKNEGVVSVTAVVLKQP